MYLCENLDNQSMGKKNSNNFDHKSTTWASRSSLQSDTEPGLLSQSLRIRRDRERLSVIFVTGLARPWSPYLLRYKISFPTSKLPLVNRLQYITQWIWSYQPSLWNWIKEIIFARPACLNINFYPFAFHVHTHGICSKQVGPNHFFMDYH